MKRLSSLLALSGMVALAVLGGRTLSAADKDTVQVPGGRAMSEFKGYEDWAVVATSETNELMKVMVANPTMIAAYKAGIPLNGKPFPEAPRSSRSSGRRRRTWRRRSTSRYRTR